MKPDLDSLRALGDVGWYCIGAILWATDYKLPKTVTALPALSRNQEGVILACGSSFDWGEDAQVATFYCSFLSNVSMDLVLCGTNGSIHTGCTAKPEKVQVDAELPQEALKIQEFATLVEHVKKCGKTLDDKWPEISRQTQLVLDAVNKSIEFGFKPVDL
ncbi:NAD(P)-binding Rossmann-fold superfamily protein [Thalictrum thalictroides]|uniref:NAD(P)-binding Rossmann-fold superfamily protein n=1 Tax=Thalictrum thalictroides TaxID=46969 RepID=A0A7J6WDD6_THATH|nr:NAD(P)-binding Rossmann-fold superfamily protein [Thalictrum thalictroides]